MMKSKTQCNQQQGKVETSRHYYKETLSDAVAEIKRKREQGWSAIIIAGDLNQYVFAEKFQRFMRENRLWEVHSKVNHMSDGRIDHTEENESMQMDAAIATEDALNSMTGSKLVDFNKIVMLDHRGFTFDVDLHYYFNMLPSNYDAMQARTLNPGNRKHRTKFQEALEECAKATQTEEKLARINHTKVSPKELNTIDDVMTYVLNAAKIEWKE